jgi:CheY-like chemotaxis protein
MLATPDHSQAPLIQSNALNGLSILIVDDNSTFRTVIQEYADSWGAQADATYNGKEALALLRNHKTTENPYDIMLIDQDMPIMNGFQLATKMQDDPDINQNIIKIMLTGTGITSQHNMVLDSGIHQVITKPVTPRALQAILAKHINIRDTTKSK